MRNRVRPRYFLFLCLCITLASAAFADDDNERTRVAHNITISPGEQVSEATCFGCSIRVRGHVSGDVTTFGGSIVVEDQGEIGGDATTFGGGLRLDKDGKVAGDVTVFGGRIHRDPAATVGGDVSNFGGPGWIVAILAIPVVCLGLFVVLVVWIVRRFRRPSISAPA